MWWPYVPQPLAGGAGVPGPTGSDYTVLTYIFSNSYCGIKLHNSQGELARGAPLSSSEVSAFGKPLLLKRMS